MTLRWLSDASLRAMRADAFGLGALADRIDPYLVWAATDRPADRPAWAPLLIELRGKATAVDFAARARRAWRGWIALGPWYDAPAARLQATRYLCAWVDLRQFADELAAGLRKAPREVAPDDLVALVGRFAYGAALASPTRLGAAHGSPAAMAAPYASWTRSAGPAPRRVVVGIVDDGIAFANGRFRSAGGTPRIGWFWDQRAVVASPTFVAGAGAPDYGTERRGEPDPTAAQPSPPKSLHQLLADHTHVGLVDEDAAYAEAGQGQVAERARHGTHVLDLAAGEARAAAGSAAAIVAVQLPQIVTDDPSGYQLEPLLVDAVRWIVDRADRLAAEAGDAAPPAVVVNVSYGVHGGPHDGSSLFESAIDGLVATREADGAPLAVVVAAGNAALSRCHASFELEPDARRTLRWRIPPDSGTPAFVELWLGHAVPGSPTGAVRVRVVPPAPAAGAGQVSVASPYAELRGHGLPDAQGTDDDHVVCTASYLARQTAPGQLSYWNDRDMVLIAVWPTAGLDPTRRWAPSGDWTVEVTQDGGSPLAVHAWIQRNDRPFGSRARGRPSRFVDPDYPLRDHGGRPIERDDDPRFPTPDRCPIRRGGTLNGIATGRRSVVVGAQRVGAGTGGRPAPSPYTARGPGVPSAADLAAGRTAPDLAAPGDTSAARRGVLATGTRSGSVAALDGTSVAAAAVTRRLAEAFADPGHATAAAALAAVIAGASAAQAPDADRVGTGGLAGPVRDGLRVPR